MYPMNGMKTARRFRAFLVVLALFPVSGSARAEKLDPAKWSLELHPAAAAPGSKVVAGLAAKIEPGWHLYSLTTPAGGPIATTIRIATAFFTLFGAVLGGYFGWRVGKRLYREYEPPVLKDRRRKAKAQPKGAK